MFSCGALARVGACSCVEALGYCCRVYQNPSKLFSYSNNQEDYLVVILEDLLQTYASSTMLQNNTLLMQAHAVDPACVSLLVASRESGYMVPMQPPHSLLTPSGPSALLPAHVLSREVLYPPER